MMIDRHDGPPSDVDISPFNTLSTSVAIPSHQGELLRLSSFFMRITSDEILFLFI